MTNVNQTTLESYNGHVQEYLDGTPLEVTGGVKDWIDASLEGLPSDAQIMEFGSAFGRDADYIESKGFHLRRTDAAVEFVRLLRSKGFEADQLNAITDDLGGPYDLVFANAVLLHFTRDEAELVTKKVHDALKPDGRFCFSLKQGYGEEFSEEKLVSL